MQLSYLSDFTLTNLLEECHIQATPRFADNPRSNQRAVMDIIKPIIEEIAQLTLQIERQNIEIDDMRKIITAVQKSK